MRPIPLVRAFWANPFFDFLEERGARVDGYLEALGLPPEVRASPERPLPARFLCRLIDDLARELDLTDIGLQVGERTPISKFDVLGDLVAAAPTLDAAIEAAIRWMPTVHSTKRLSLALSGPQARLLARTHGERPAPCEDHFTLCLMIDLIRQAAGPAWLPGTVELESPAIPGAGRVCTSQAGIHGNAGVTSVAFPHELLTVPCGSIARRRQRPVDREPLPTEIGACLRSVLALLIPAGRTDLDGVAEMLDVSPRTLQRRLQKSGDRFSNLLESSRLSLARALLDDPSRKVVEVAFELGYSDHAHFTSAFHRWTGVSPRDFRRVPRRRKLAREPATTAYDRRTHQNGKRRAAAPSDRITESILARP